MWLMWLALIVGAFFAGKYAGDSITKIFVWLWKKFIGIFKKK
jgi:hypothetical protein